MARLTINDYLKILDYYNIDSRGMKNKRIHAVAKDILANKLCRCIKKIATTTETRAIAICKNSIFTKKRLTVGRFKCKKRASLIPSKNGNTLLKLNTLKRRR
jgi:hypothetical protein